MIYAIGDAVRLRDGSDMDELLGPAAGLTGTVGDAWEDERGERISVVYADVEVLAYGLPASHFAPDARPVAGLGRR